jgi:hypothetical protein
MEWIPKEITMVLHAGNSQEEGYKLKSEQCDDLLYLVSHNLLWLNRVIEKAKRIARQSSNFGIFGTAIAGTWLGGVLGESVNFFIDEDPLRVGKRHLGLPVLLPSEVPSESCVYLVLPSLLANQVYRRLRKSQPHLKLILPPAM